MSECNHRADQSAALLAAAYETVCAAQKAAMDAGCGGRHEEVIALALIACAGIGGARSLIGS